MPDKGESDGCEARRAAWASSQRALARALGLTIQEWSEELYAASERPSSLRAAVMGAAIAEGLGLGVLSELDEKALGLRARDLVDPLPPRVQDKVLAEAVRRSEELENHAGRGARRLRKRRGEDLPVPQSEVRPLGGSAVEATADAPGDPEGKH